MPVFVLPFVDNILPQRSLNSAQSIRRQIHMLFDCFQQTQLLLFFLEEHSCSGKNMFFISFKSIFERLIKSVAFYSLILSLFNLFHVHF